MGRNLAQSIRLVCGGLSCHESLGVKDVGQEGSRDHRCDMILVRIHTVPCLVVSA